MLPGGAASSRATPASCTRRRWRAIVLFVILALAIWKWQLLAKPGYVTGLFLVGYGVIRALAGECAPAGRRLDHLPLGLTMGMMLSIPMILVGAWLIWRAWKPAAGPPPTPDRCRSQDRLAREIALTGPMTVADYVTRCLHDPKDGYYATRPALGAGGDFITAPLVSQMFGELIGLWAVETWRRLGAPERFRLVEVGPGDGTLMDDALRAARLAPDFLQRLRPDPDRASAAAARRAGAQAGRQPTCIAALGRVAGPGSRRTRR